MRRISLLVTTVTLLGLFAALSAPGVLGASHSTRTPGEALRHRLDHVFAIRHQLDRIRSVRRHQNDSHPSASNTPTVDLAEKELRGDRPRLYRRATPTPTVTPRSGAPSGSTRGAGGFLRINGRAFSYGGFNNVILRGTNFSNEPADACSNGGTPDITKINVNNADYNRLSSWGGNVVRFDLDYGWYAADRARFFAVIDRHIQYARSNHLWLIPSLGSAPGGGCDFHQTDFWDNPGNQNLVNGFWRDFAAHYANEPTIAGYDILNEPGTTEADWQRVAQRFRDTITAVDPNHFVVYESTTQDAWPLKGNNIVYSDHLYPDGFNYSPSVPANAPRFIGEFGGKRSDGTASLSFVREQIARFERDGVHWAYFVMRENANGFGLYGCYGAGDFSCPWDEMIAIVGSSMRGSIKP